MTRIVLALIIAFSAGLVAAPPKQPPKELLDRYTLNGVIPIKYWYFDSTYTDDNCLVYTKNSIEANIKKVKKRKVGHYPKTDAYLYKAIEQHLDKIKGKSIAIMGSTTSWYESMMLAYGGHPTTIEYNKIISKNPKLKVLTVDEFKACPRTFDVVLSISSFEHDGLGRYGDPLDPEGDLKAMESVKSMLKPNGILILAVPVGKDTIYWNAHRVYGQRRLPMLLQGWTTIGSYGFSPIDLTTQSREVHQPVFVLKKESAK